MGWERGWKSRLNSSSNSERTSTDKGKAKSKASEDFDKQLASSLLLPSPLPLLSYPPGSAITLQFSLRS
jgi:hypothetical protein